MIMEAPSFVSKARTAFHSAAAKAERVLSDFKPDRADYDKQSSKDLVKRTDDESPWIEGRLKSHSEPSKWRSARKGTKQDWQDRLKNIRIGRKGVGDTEKVENPVMAVAFYDENLYLLNMKNDLEAKAAEEIPSVESFITVDGDSIPPFSVVKQLALAIEAGKKCKSVKDLLAPSGTSSPGRERPLLSLAAVKSLVLREKEEKITTEFGCDERVQSLIHSLFNAEGEFLKRELTSAQNGTIVTSLPKDIHGAPPQSLVVKIAEVIGTFKTTRKMAHFWCRIVKEMRRLWLEEQHVPGIPFDEIPDLNSCLLYQQLQVINCCISRKRRQEIATESLESVMREASSIESNVLNGTVPPSTLLYARISTGGLVLRLGADRAFSDVKMLETGELVYSPVTQEEPLLTEDVIKATEEFVLQTGSVGAGCSQLLSDMQAFKAANPGCILADFVRWHSPPDWTESEPSSHAIDSPVAGNSRGQLSSRMQKEGNLWLELWDTAKPVPAVKQAPLFDEDLAVEGIHNDLENISPSELFKQLFVSLVGLGFVMAEAKLSNNNDLSKLFCECKDYIIATFETGCWIDKVDDICQVYKALESMMLVNSEEVVKNSKQPGNAVCPKRRFKRLSLNFGKERFPRMRNSEENSV